jgi:hypothetical protein
MPQTVSEAPSLDRENIGDTYNEAGHDKSTTRNRYPHRLPAIGVDFTNHPSESVRHSLDYHNPSQPSMHQVESIERYSQERNEGIVPPRHQK